MAKVVSKQKRIDDIVPMLEEGIETKQILRKITESYGVSIASVEKDIKDAKLIVAERNRQKEAIRVDITTKVLKKVLEKAIRSDMELEAILCTIATGNAKVEEIVQGKAVFRGITPSEMTNAIDKIFKKRGSNAPTKVAQTDVEGNDAKVKVIGVQFIE